MLAAMLSALFMLCLSARAAVPEVRKLLAYSTLPGCFLLESAARIGLKEKLEEQVV